MATNYASLTTLFFLFITFTIKLKFSTAASGRALLDIDGNHLNSTSSYSIFPLGWGKNNGGVSITIASDVKGFVVGLDRDKTFRGEPARFAKITRSRKIVELNDIVAIDFFNKVTNQSTPWIIVYDELAKVWFVGSGLIHDFAGHQTKTGTFRISYVNASGYKLGFCAHGNTSSCKDIGIYKDSFLDNSILAINGPPLIVNFKVNNS